GSYRTLEWTTAPSLKRRILCAVARDVTESDREQERLAHLVNASRAVVYSLALGPGGVTACTFMSDNVTPQLGYAASEMIGDGRAWLSCLHPDDAPRMAKG